MHGGDDQGLHRREELTRKKTEGRLHELAPATRGSQEAGSRNLCILSLLSHVCTNVLSVGAGTKELR